MMSTAEQTNKTTAAGSSQRINARNWLAIGVFLLTCFVPGWQRTNDALQVLPEISKSDLPNFDQVHSYLWRGAAPSWAGMDQLKSMGVKTIVDLRRSADRIAGERQYCQMRGIRYVSLPMGDFVPGINKQTMFLQVVNDAATHPENGPVFLHCSHGSDRTGYLTALWRVQHDHWSIAEAAIEMLQHGFVVHKFGPNPAR